MLNIKFIESRIRLYANGFNEISTEEFCELFYGFDENEMEEIITVIQNMGISVVDEKREDKVVCGEGKFMNAAVSPSDLTALTNEQLCLEYKEGNKWALDVLVEKNKRLVYKIAYKTLKTYNQRTLDINDLYNEGNLGLMKAAEKFDISKGFKFTTYACWWIRQAMTREIINNGYTVRIPVHMFEQIMNVNRCRSKYNAENVFELYEYMKREGYDYSLDKLEMLLEYNDMYFNTRSLNEIVRADEAGSTERMHFVKDSFNMENEVMKSSLSVELRNCMSEILSERECIVLKKRYGIDSGIPMTLEEIGCEFKVTRERIRQIEAKALIKIRKSWKAMGLREYLCA